MAKSTGIAQFSEGRSEVHRVDPRKLIIRAGWNMRDDNDELEAHIDELAKSIAKIGVKKPIEVKMEDGQMVVKEGHCRTRAAIKAIEVYKADLKTVPVIATDRYASDEDLILNQVIGNSGKPFTSMEKARIFKKLLDMGWTQVDIGEKSGLSNGRISQILDLLTMPAATQALVASGAVSPSLAQSTVKAAETPAAASQALQEAAAKAQAEGRKKIKPDDIQDSPTAPRKFSVKECLENSEIDCSEEAIAEGYIVIKMPIEDWELIRNALKL